MFTNHPPEEQYQSIPEKFNSSLINIEALKTNEDLGGFSIDTINNLNGQKFPFFSKN